jgi:phosphoribosyl-ATP pyrophosphohydrolase
MSIFAQQKKFMTVCGQEPSASNEFLYYKLIKEEVAELVEAWDANDRVEIVDACIDIIYVVTGLMHSMGLNPQPFWDEVQRSNMSKFLIEACVFCGAKGCDECDGQGVFFKVMRREDGKILKGPNYSPPDLCRIYKEQVHD